MPGELARDAGLSAEEEIARVMNSVIDRLQQEISIRFLRLKKLNTKFGFLLDVKTLLAETNVDTLRQNCLDFGNFYDADVNGHKLCTEIGDCKMLLSTRTEVLPETSLDLLGFIVSYEDDVFLNLILSYLRALMGQDLLSDPALLSIERETLENINFDNVIDEYVTFKSKRIIFCRLCLIV